MYSTVLAYSVLLVLSAGTLATADQNANVDHAMNITLFGNPDCAGTKQLSNITSGLGWNQNEVVWGIDNQTVKYLSYKLSRATTQEEQLDFSGANEDGSDPHDLGPLCALFHETASPGAEGHTLNANQCYNLTKPATVSILPIPAPPILQLLMIYIQCARLFQPQ